MQPVHAAGEIALEIPSLAVGTRSPAKENEILFEQLSGASDLSSGSVDAAIRAVPGVQNVSISPVDNVATITFNPAVCGPRTILAALKSVRSFS